jgi:penicillin-binding protein 2
MNSYKRERNKASIRVLIGIVLLIGSIIIGRLYQLQILEYETYGPLSRENSLRQEQVHPSRGLIYDNKGKLLADNEPIYTITITPSKFDKNKTALLAKLVNEDSTKLGDLIKQAQKYSWQRPSRLFPEVTFEVFSKIEEHIWELPGIAHQIESRRFYPTSVKASHILGYLRELTEQQFKKLNDNYRLGDKAGVTGLETIYEQKLRGYLGTSFTRINAYGQALGAYDDGALDIPPISGRNIYTTIDTDLQQLAEELMTNKVGAVVAMDPRNGAIRAMVSSPFFDLSRLAGKLDNEYWAQINADTSKPLFNRAVSAMQPPGSTFKPLMALIGLKLGLITPKTVVYCNREYKCTAAHGEQTVEFAIQNSCNTFFFSLMNKIGVSGEFNNWSKMVKTLGLGSINGIDLPNESRGIIPDSAYFNRVFGKQKWGIGDIINLGIGQGAIGVTPMQSAVMISAIANGGYLVKPHLVNEITDTLGQRQVIEYPVKKIDWLNSEDLKLVQRGMRRVVTDGSARWYANIKEVLIAGKTGTAQNPHGFDHAWFASFAPIDNPELVIVVLVENGGFGASSALPIASLMMEKYFTGAVQRPWLYQKMLEFEAKAAVVRR